MMAIGAAVINGTRQPQANMVSEPSTKVSNVTRAAAPIDQDNDPTYSPLAINPRFLSGVDSAINVIAPAYSPPAEKPCTILAASSKMGAVMPMDAYEGMIPMQSVASDIMINVIARIFFRPNRSPNMPKNMPPIGRTKNATANVPKLKINCVESLKSE